MDYLASQSVINCKEINLPLIHAYIKTLAGYTYKTVEQSICSLRTFFRFLLETEEVETDLQDLASTNGFDISKIESATVKPRLEGKSQKDSTPRQRRSRNSDQVVTSQSVLREYIVQALKEFGGSARRSNVLDRIEEMLEGQLTPRDFETRSDGRVIIWRNNACWERQAMVDEGILRNDSKFGYWELNPDHASDVQQTPAYKSI